MIKKLLSLLGKNPKTNNDFSDFFRHASKEEQAKVYTEALKKANKDQQRTYEEALKPQN